MWLSGSEGKVEWHEVEMLGADETSGGSSKVRNVTCARDDDHFGRQHTKTLQLVRLSHARETCARVMRARCGVLFTTCKMNGLLGVIQSYGCPQAPHHQPLMLVILSFSPWFVDAHQTKILNWEQLAMLTDISERDSSSSCFT